MYSHAVVTMLYSAPVISTKVQETLVRHENGSISATVHIPTDMDFMLLRLHTACNVHNFRMHVVLDVKHGMADVFEVIDQYTMFIPPTREIGVSPKGEARFPVMVNASGTPFVFGLVQAELALYSKRPNDVEFTFFNPFSAYSFYPSEKTSPIQLHVYEQTNQLYHADIILKSDKLYQTGTIMSILSACTISAPSIVRRLDMKQILYLNPTATATPVTSMTLGFIDEEYNIHVKPNDHGLIRCTLIGNPPRNVMLHKKNADGTNVMVHAPEHSTYLKYKTTTVFHLLNVSQSDVGDYYCHATDGVRNVETQIHKVLLQTPDTANTVV